MKHLLSDEPFWKNLSLWQRRFTTTIILLATGTVCIVTVKFDLVHNHPWYLAGLALLCGLSYTTTVLLFNLKNNGWRIDKL